MMPAPSLFERKLLWYMNNICDKVGLDEIALIKISHFDKSGKLVFGNTKKNRKEYMQYWKKITACSDENFPVETEDPGS